MWTHNDLYNGEMSHTEFIFFLLTERYRYSFEASMEKNKPTKQKSLVVLAFLQWHLDSEFLLLLLSMEILKNHLLGKFCNVNKKYRWNIRNKQMTLSKIDHSRNLWGCAHLEAAVVTLRTYEGVPIFEMLSMITGNFSIFY
jgi:hypothetical protein